MTEVYFHCSTDQHVLIDRSGTPMDLADARAHAERMVHTMIMTPSAEDWRVHKMVLNHSRVDVRSREQA